MQGTFSMAFQGKKMDLLKLLAGAERLKEEAPDFWTWWQEEQRLPKNFDTLPDDAETGLVVDEDWGNASGMEELFLGKLRSFAPALEAAFYSSYDDPDSVAYLYFPSGAEDAIEAESYVEPGEDMEDMLDEDGFPILGEEDEDGNIIDTRERRFSPEEYAFIQKLWVLPE